MGKTSFRLRRNFIYFMPLYCLLFVCCFTYIQDYEGPKLPSSQTARLYLDKGWWREAGYLLPISAEVDGKPRNIYKDPSAECLLLLPGEHVVTLLAEPHTESARGEYRDPQGITTPVIVEVKIWPTPQQHFLKFKAEKGGEYLIGQGKSDSAHMNGVFWIEDKISKKRITGEFLFEWK